MHSIYDCGIPIMGRLCLAIPSCNALNLWIMLNDNAEVWCGTWTYGLRSFFYPFESYLEHLTDHRYTVCLKWIENERGQCHNIFFLYLHCLQNSKYKVSSLCTCPSNYAKFYEVTGKFTLLTTVYTVQCVHQWIKQPDNTLRVKVDINIYIS